MIRHAILVLVLSALGGCREGTAPSSQQDRGLNEADALLNDASNGLDSVDDQGLGAGEIANAE